MAIKTYWVDGTRADDTGDGESYATAKKTLAAGLTLLNVQSTKGDILNVVNSVTYEWPAAGTVIAKGRGTSRTDYGRLIRGVSDALATPGLVTIAATVDATHEFLRMNSTGDTEATAAGWIILENLNFDATALGATRGATVCFSIDTAGRIGPVIGRYCAFKFAASGGTRPSVTRKVLNQSSYGSKYGSSQFEYCYFLNAEYPFDNLASYGSNLRTSKLDHCVYIWDIATMSSSLWALVGILTAGAHTIDFTHNTYYVSTGATSFGALVSAQLDSNGLDIGTLNLHSNLMWQESSSISAKLGKLISQSSPGFTAVTNAGIVGYNVLLGGPSMSAADIGTYGWYQAPYDPVDVSGENDAKATDVTAFEVADTAIFAAPGSTYDWVMPNDVVITIAKDLRPQTYETSGYNGSTPGALPAYSTNYLATIVVDRPVPSVNDTVRYTITIGNTGYNATNVDVSAIIPGGITYVSHVASAGTFDYTTGAWAIPTLNDGATVTLTVVTTVDPDQAGETITYTVEVTDGDPTPDPDELADDTDSVAIYVVSTARVPYLDVEPIFAPDLRLEINSSFRAYVNRLRRAYLRFDDEHIRWYEYATKQLVVGAAETVDLTTGLEYYYYIILDADNPVEVSVGPDGSDVFFPQCTRILLAPTFAERIQVRNPGTTNATVTITVVDNGNAE